ncbi:spore coat protein GerQ [Paenibacillus chibensis]|uniref:spore coat protein GerQ n=1 Tax=Paenibacillus chibensis TaxID=59846 RepID=UPI001580FB7D
MMPQPFRPTSYNMGGSMGSGYPGLSGSGMGMPGGMPGGMPMGSMGAVPPQVTSGSPMGPAGTVYQAPPQQQFEQSYVENILRLNLGKTGTFYMTYENNSQWNAKIFTGVIEAAGRDHIIISDRSTGQRILLLTLNLDYITFNEPLIYQYPGVIGNPGQGR